MPYAHVLFLISDEGVARLSRPIIHCSLGHSFFPIPATSFQVAERSFGDNDGSTPSRIRRGDCNRLFRVPAILDQSTTPQGLAHDVFQRLPPQTESETRQ